MADCMDFPENYEDFLNRYSFKDKKHSYTIGSDLIPVFYVKQLIEHYFNDKKDKKFALKPCPFCGGKGKIIPTKTTYDIRVWHVECENCQATTAWKDEPIKSEDAFKNMLSTVSLVVDSWNRRS